LKQEKNTFPSTTSLFGCAHFVCNSCSIRTRTALLTYFVAQPQAIVIGERAVFGHAIEEDQQQVSERLERSGWNAGQHQKKSKSL
jgi:hypothetical protein